MLVDKTDMSKHDCSKSNAGAENDPLQVNLTKAVYFLIRKIYFFCVSQ